MSRPHLLLVAVSLLVGCVHRVPIVAKNGEGPRQDPPEGTVELNVVADDTRESWTLEVPGEEPCQTPCSRWVANSTRLTIVSPRDEAFGIEALAVEAPGVRRLMIVGEGASQAKKVNGIVFTSFGSMAVITAIPLLALGCGDFERRGGMCTAGLVTMGIGAPVTAFFIWLLVDSLPKLHLLPLALRQRDSPMTVAASPLGLSGTF